MSDKPTIDLKEALEKHQKSSMECWDNLEKGEIGNAMLDTIMANATAIHTILQFLIDKEKRKKPNSDGYYDNNWDKLPAPLEGE